MHPRIERSPRLSRAVSATVGDRYTTTVSAEVVGSWIGRLYHHHMTPCEVWDARSPARRPHRLVRRFRCVLGEALAVRERARESARAATVSAISVG